MAWLMDFASVCMPRLPVARLRLFAAPGSIFPVANTTAASGLEWRSTIILADCYSPITDHKSSYLGRLVDRSRSSQFGLLLVVSKARLEV